MLSTETAAEIQAAIASTLRPQLPLPVFQKLKPKVQRALLESAHSFLFNRDALRTDKLAIVASLQILATDANKSVKAIARKTLERWNTPPI